MKNATNNDVRSVDELWVKSLVARSVLRAANAMTAPDKSPSNRLGVLMECHGELLTARGPGSYLSFADFRRQVCGDPSQLLPEGVPGWDVDELCVVDTDGHVTEDAFDIAAEQRLVLRILQKGGRGAGLLSGQDVDDEVAQETAFAQLCKAGNQKVYESGRTDLIRYPAGPVSELSELRLPPLVADLYKDIPYASRYRGWWFACPVCRWPMRIALRREAGQPVGVVDCWHEPHQEMGATYRFRPVEGIVPPELLPGPPPPPPDDREAVLWPDLEYVPEAKPIEGHKALVRGVWRYTCIPGLPELALRDRLVDRGLKVDLWPALDAYDLCVHVGRKRTRKKEQLRVDVKDYTSGTALAQLIHAQEGDSGGAEWLVVPDHRATQVHLLSGVGKRYGLNVATASEFGAMVCERSGVAWT
ncbi:restriction endonuclease-related protein [Streptomyces sp. NPDC002403]